LAGGGKGGSEKEQLIAKTGIRQGRGKNGLGQNLVSRTAAREKKKVPGNRQQLKKP